MTRHTALSLIATSALLLMASMTRAQDQPTPKVEILKPSAGDTVKESVDICIEMTLPEGSQLPSQVFVGLGGPPWIPLTPVETAENQFAGRLDTRLVPNGPQALKVITSQRKAKAEIPVTVKNELKIYFGDLHSHTAYSDGTLLPSIAHDYARHEAKLQVFCLTDHLEAVDDAEWLDMREVAWDANEDGQFVAIPGLEWTKKWGHLNIYDPQTRYWPEDPAKFYQAAADAGVVLKFNHPGDGTKTHDGLAYSEVGDRAVQLMEVRRPEEEQAFIRALRHGWHLAPDGSDDTHAANWGNVRSWTGILAPALTKRNILDALAKRHVYSTTDRELSLRFTVNDAMMGDIIEEPVQQLQVFAQAMDGDPTDRPAKIELIEDGEVVATDTSGFHFWGTRLSPKPGSHFYYVRVTQADGDMAWSAPVWVTVAAEPNAPEITKRTYTYKQVGNCAIQADVYRLPGDDIRPVLVWIHGGALISGDREVIEHEVLQDYLRGYLEAGFVVVSIDYRLAPETKLAGIIEDLQDAFRWIREEGPTAFKVDAERIAVTGGSAGGYLTLMSGFCVQPRPKVLVSFYGYGDITGKWYAEPDQFYSQQPAVSKEEAYEGVGGEPLSGCSFFSEAGAKRGKFYLYCRQNGLWCQEVANHDPQKEPEKLVPFCPLKNVTGDFPPTMLLHGDQDTDVPHEQSLMMAAALERCEVPHELCILQGQGHGFEGVLVDGEFQKNKDPQVIQAFQTVLAFLQKHIQED